jgi:hypothetical protein
MIARTAILVWIVPIAIIALPAWIARIVSVALTAMDCVAKQDGSTTSRRPVDTIIIDSCNDCNIIIVIIIVIVIVVVVIPR